MAIAANIIIIVLEVIGLYLSAKRGGWKILQFYTQLSNIFALLSSILFLLVGEKAAWLRYTAVCLLTMTFLVSLFILVPMGAGFKKMMLTNSGLFHHTLCPILSFVSYALWEPHSSVWFLPVISCVGSSQRYSPNRIVLLGLYLYPMELSAQRAVIRLRLNVKTSFSVPRFSLQRSL